MYSSQNALLLQQSEDPARDASEEPHIKQELKDHFDRYNLSQISNSKELFGEDIESPLFKKEKHEYDGNILYPMGYGSPGGNHSSNDVSSQSVSIKLEANLNSSNNTPFHLNSQSNGSLFSLFNANTPYKISSAAQTAQRHFMIAPTAIFPREASSRSFTKDLSFLHQISGVQGHARHPGEQFDFNRIFLKKEMSPPQLVHNFLYPEDFPLAHPQGGNGYNTNNNSASNTPIYTLDPKNEYIEYEQPSLGMMFGVKNCDKILNFDNIFPDEEPTQETPEKQLELSFEGATPKKNVLQESPPDMREARAPKVMTPLKKVPQDEKTTEKKRPKRELRLLPDRFSLSRRDRDEAQRRTENAISTSDQEETPARSSRGLRVLSLRVKEIVCETRDTTYKEVADKLISDLETRAFGGFKKSDNPKEEQNIKRRVYDALNVLIAADVLKKKGKKVFCEEPSNVSGVFMGSSKDRRKAREELIRKKEIVSSKRESLKEMVLKFFALHNLLSRNRNLTSEKLTSAKKSSAVDEPRKKRKEAENQDKEIIYFPFIVLFVHRPGDIVITSSRDKSMMKICSERAFSIQGDVDILLKLNFHNQNVRENFETLLPKEIQRGISAELL